MENQLCEYRVILSKAKVKLSCCEHLTRNRPEYVYRAKVASRHNVLIPAFFSAVRRPGSRQTLHLNLLLRSNSLIREKVL